MFLSLDAGNSNIVISFFDPLSREWTREFRLETRANLSEAELNQRIGLYLLENEIRVDAITRIGISSVVPEVNRTLESFSRNFLRKEPYLISGRSYERLPIRTEKPDEIGSDLMCNVMAAYTRYQSACVVVDFGTALTFTVVSASGEVLGVNIVPGIKTALKSLFTNTAKLPEVRLEVPASAIGRDTVHSIQAGVIYGYVGLVNGMLDAIFDELGSATPVIGTGGLSHLLPKLEHRFDHIDRRLTVEGIRLITEANNT
ncbi:Pantothenate kinase type III, CoaX-like protein [Lunatimonas lonarensis]|uniref:Type III pantothenate kinase n=1 Tax=Lunatimonas lonarensis TaxID=1232681 RepID=R7ZKZ4_9BACT|nr:type III pantothenate kinase [Lunatimonas lonarensis]EON74763.1 Pantothenate kinase type III, CoaX-like protein [Lunatimonas lonarensis]